MKVLVLSCSTGGGHNSCGRYIASEFNLNKIECDFVDYFSILGNKLSKQIEKLYLQSTKGKGTIFKGVYKLGEVYSKVGITSPVYELNKLAKNKMLMFINEHHYDVVICPHLFPAMAITALKRDGIAITLINVATDYTNIPFWNETKPDYFVIPHASLKDEFTKKGIDVKVLLPIGIPVATSFQEKNRTVSFKKDKPNLLITSGSMGFGNIDGIVKKVLNNIDAYVTVICGNNEKLLKKLGKIKDPHLVVKGFVDNMGDYIRESDVVLTKPGGLTSTEVAVLNRPMIHIMPIPGVENYNADFFQNNHLSLVSHTLDEIVENIKSILQDDKLRAMMLQNQRAFINKDAAKDLVDFVKTHIS